MQPRLQRAKPNQDRYTQVATLFDPDHFTGREGGARASLAYDPIVGHLHWTARDRSGSTGEFKKVPFSEVLGFAEGDEELAVELRRATENAKTHARRRIKELRADGSPSSLQAARRLEAAVKDSWLKTR